MNENVGTKRGGLQGLVMETTGKGHNTDIHQKPTCTKAIASGRLPAHRGVHLTLASEALGGNGIHPINLIWCAV